MASFKNQAFSTARTVALTEENFYDSVKAVATLLPKDKGGQSHRDLRRLLLALSQNPTYTPSLHIRLLKWSYRLGSTPWKVAPKTPDPVTQDPRAIFPLMARYPFPQEPYATDLAVVAGTWLRNASIHELMSPPSPPGTWPQPLQRHPALYAQLIGAEFSLFNRLLLIPDGVHQFLLRLGTLSVDPTIGDAQEILFQNLSVLEPNLSSLAPIDPSLYLATPVLAAMLAAHIPSSPLLRSLPPITIATLFGSIPDSLADHLFSQFPDIDLSTWPKEATARALTSISRTVKERFFATLRRPAR